MTEQPSRRRSLAEELDASDPIGMAAAGAAVDAVALLNDAVHCADVRQNELASRVGVSEGRVSQVVNGDGNLRVSTLARYLRAAGYQLRLDAVPVESDTPPLRTSQRETHRDEAIAAFKVATGLSGEDLHRACEVEFSATLLSPFVDTGGWEANRATGKTGRGPASHF